MSEKFTGVTFAKQKVTPSDDAIIRRAILPDGILTGCELSYSGSTLTMAPGHLMICGRQIRMPSVQNWAIVDATSGFARLVLTIDLTRTATKETFDQVVDSIEYASAEDGFVALDQTDINLSGTRYQIVVCVVSLGTGGITGIVSQIEKSAIDGSGALNFNVVGGLTQPSNPKEITIWVPTSEKITSWIFAAEAPAEPAEGMVWFLTGKTSQAAFNALRKNTVMVYPLSAKQYVGGVWIDKTAKTYKNGAWADWIVWIYDAGKFDSSITTSEKKIPTSASIVYGDKDITLSTVAGKTSEVYVVVGPMNIGAISKLVLEGTFVKKTTTAFTNVATIFVAESNDASYKDAVAIATVEMKESLDAGYQYVVELDVSSISGEYYISSGVNTQGNGWEAQRVNTITTIRGEP